MKLMNRAYCNDEWMTIETEYMECTLTKAGKLDKRFNRIPCGRKKSRYQDRKAYEQAKAAIMASFEKLNIALFK